MIILAIETSCDDTGVAVMKIDEKGNCQLLSNIVSSQVKIHAPYGGVVPNLAQRAHQVNLVPVLELALREAAELRIMNYESRERKDKIKEILKREPVLLEKLSEFLNKYEKPNIDLISITYGPGLAPCLWVGVNFAKALSCAWNVPIAPVNHIEAHIAANWLVLSDGNYNQKRKSGFPILCLVVSGGHTQLILMNPAPRGCGIKYVIIGETRDDAAGEAFDKVAKLLGLGYPGGMAVAEQARQFKVTSSKLKVKFPRPMINTDDFDFSFSGLKTAVLYFVKTLTSQEIKKLTPAICAEFEQAVVDVLIKKTMRAAEKYSVKTVMLAGGVSANNLLRETLRYAAEGKALQFITPRIEFCSDNAGMVAMAGWWHRDKTEKWEDVMAEANLRIN